MGDEIYAAHGKALAAWAHVEKELHLLYGYLGPFTLDRKQADVILIIYAAITGIGARIRVIDALARHQLDGSALAHLWHSLHGRINQAKQDRNGIAHWPIYHENGNLFMAPQAIKVDKDGNLTEPTRRLTAMELTTITQSFLVLSTDIRSFWADVKQHRKPAPRSVSS